jgi:hypothetical protein
LTVYHGPVEKIPREGTDHRESKDRKTYEYYFSVPGRWGDKVVNKCTSAHSSKMTREAATAKARKLKAEASCWARSLIKLV